METRMFYFIILLQMSHVILVQSFLFCFMDFECKIPKCDIQHDNFNIYKQNNRKYLHDYEG